MQSDRYEFYKNHKNDKVWWVEHYIILDKDRPITSDNVDKLLGELLISFDKKNIFNLWIDYPHKLTKEQKEIFDKENPFWRDFFKGRTQNSN